MRAVPHKLNQYWYASPPSPPPTPSFGSLEGQQKFTVQTHVGPVRGPEETRSARLKHHLPTLAREYLDRRRTFPYCAQTSPWESLPCPLTRITRASLPLPEENTIPPLPIRTFAERSSPRRARSSPIEPGIPPARGQGGFHATFWRCVIEGLPYSAYSTTMLFLSRAQYGPSSGPRPTRSVECHGNSRRVPPVPPSPLLPSLPVILPISIAGPTAPGNQLLFPPRARPRPQ